MPVELLMTGLVQGALLAIMAFGVMLAFTILQMPDLSAEGALPLAACVCCVALQYGIHPVLSVVFGMLAGGLLSLGVSVIAVRFRVNILLAGVIVSTMAYSVDLRLLGRANVPLFAYPPLPVDGVLLLPLLVLLVVGTAIFLHTDYGLRLTAVGKNRRFSQLNAIDVTAYPHAVFFVAGCCYGLAGSLLTHAQQYVDVGMGVGMAVHALASLMIGAYLLGKETVRQKVLAPIVGALLYQQIQGLVLFMGLAPSDLKFFTALMVLLLCSFPAAYGDKPGQSSQVMV